MIKSIRFIARPGGHNIYLKADRRQSSIRERSTLTSKEENRKKMGLPKKTAKIPPLNEIVLTRIHIKAHTFSCHSPELIRLRTKAMWMMWEKRFVRLGRNANYHNKYSLHRFL